jgi:hypothetical protein
MWSYDVLDVTCGSTCDYLLLYTSTRGLEDNPNSLAFLLDVGCLWYSVDHCRFCKG